MRIAIVGSGISGMVAAHLLHPTHEITVFEANDYAGGHTNTIRVTDAGDEVDVDTGFIVFNDRNYPNFEKLMDRLGVDSIPTPMSFSVHGASQNLEYNGSSLNGLFAQRRNLLRPSFHRMIRDILRFNREATKLVERSGEDETLDEFLKRHGFGKEFANHYLLPMGAAIWSCPMATFGQFPIQFIVEFYHNHGLLQIRDRPQWRVIAGGSQRYVERLTEPFYDRIRLNEPVRSVERGEDTVRVGLSDNAVEEFDEIVFACHSDQALRMLRDPTPTETEVLGHFPYGLNTAVLHTDESVLPKRRRAWASWNYRLGDEPDQLPTLTYNMNILQHLHTHRTYCVTLNDEDRINPETIIGRYRYAHPIFTTARAAAQRRHDELIRQRRSSFCGAYWGNGFHEDGVNSAIAVCRAFGIDFHAEPDPVNLHVPETVLT